MFHYIARRLLLMIPTLFLISILAFIVIELPPGDFVTSRIMALLEDGDTASLAEVENLRHIYGLDKPLYLRYWWCSKFGWQRYNCRFNWQYIKKSPYYRVGTEAGSLS